MSAKYRIPILLNDVMDIRSVDRIITHMCVLQERRDRLRKRNTAILDWSKRWQRVGDW